MRSRFYRQSPQNSSNKACPVWTRDFHWTCFFSFEATISSSFLLAVIWIQENNCSVPIPRSQVDQLYLANAALIDDDSVVTDLELEAAAFLYFSGHGSLVDQDFPNRVITAQNGDGGWSLSSKDPGNSYWHSTIVGLLLLLHLEYPAQSYEPTISSKS